MNNNFHVDLDTLINVIKTIPSNIFFKDRDLKYIFSSHIWEQIDSGDDENFDIYGKSDRDVRKDKTNLDNAEKSDKEIIETGIGRHYTIKAEVDGHTQYLDITKEPVKDEDGNVLGIVGLINDVSQVSEEIQRQYEENIKEAERVSKMKSDFLANTSHEIRTPLNAILGMNDIILRDFDNPQLLEYATIIKNAGNTLLSLINDLLDFSKIEAGKLDIIPDKYYFGSFVNDLMNMIKLKASNKNLELITEFDPNIPTELYGDENRIKQIAINLLNNAIKYTEKGFVKFKITLVEQNDDMCKIKYEIIDSGIGIKEEDIKNLTLSFTRLEEQRNKNIEGTGLGIAISDKLLKQMNSKLEVESVYGEGSTFGFVLEQKVIDKTPFNCEDEKDLSYEKKNYQPFVAPYANILIVDDVEFNLKVATGLLNKLELKIDTALSGKEAIEMCKKKKYNIVLMDHMMPEMDGVETMHHIKNEIEGYVDIPVIALTANVVSDARKKLINEGFDDFIPKPIDVDFIYSVILKWLPNNLVIIKDDEDDSKFNLTDIEIEGINQEKALAYLKDIDTLNSTLLSFYESIDDDLKDLKYFLSNYDFNNFKLKIHEIKNVAKSIGADNLSDKAEELEDIAESKEVKTLNEKFDSFEKYFNGFKEKLEDTFKNKCSSKKLDEKKEKIDKDKIVYLLENIVESANEFNMDKIEAILKILHRFNIEDYVDEDELNNYIKQYNYSQIKEFANLTIGKIK